MPEVASLKFHMEVDESGKLLVRDPVLLQNLIQNPQQTIEGLSHRFSAVTLDDVDIDSEGRVVFANELFAQSVVSIAVSALVGSNIRCNNATLTAGTYAWVTGVSNNLCCNIKSQVATNDHCR